MSTKQYSLNASKSSHICVSLEEDNEFGWKVYLLKCMQKYAE
jgi:hypothetical protein